MKVKKIRKNGFTIYTIINKRINELCDFCEKRNKDSKINNCHINNQVSDLAKMLAISMPILECISFKGEAEEIKTEHFEKDSGEE